MGDRRKLIIIGGKGNGTVVASAVEDIVADGGAWELLGFLNDSHKVGDELQGYPVLGRPEDAPRLNGEDCYFYYGLLSAKTSLPRVHRLKRLGVPTEKFATLVHPTVRLSRNVRLGHGVAIMPFVDVGRNAVLGNHILIHGHSYVARDTVLKDYSYLAPRATLGAEAVLEEGAYLGTSSSVLERVNIGAWSVVGLGAIVLKDVPTFAIMVGNPARAIGTVETDGKKDQS